MCSLSFFRSPVFALLQRELEDEKMEGTVGLIRAIIYLIDRACFTTLLGRERPDRQGRVNA
jgi:hypothetical protein